MDAGLLKTVNNPVGEWHLRPDDHQFNTPCLGFLNQLFDIIGGDIKVMAEFRRAGITRSDKYLLCLGALCQLPDKGVLPSSTPDNQYPDLPHPLNSSPLIPLPC